ncbi:hypothetical protein ASPFODRAFT_213296 [Aspergillus luchuensis CBS 106.47]|uniref:Uncharacterized protein n=1 Tax=Aspergillus luchuensis (strain CBS 106.47) TaxID=1137211 RepID=A0A1M3SYB7_ASPLC|nr:hypothetical protein ASPFODRAFT_213296 [Aspergillus luchuensis CBS 106.47]
MLENRRQMSTSVISTRLMRAFSKEAIINLLNSLHLKRLGKFTMFSRRMCPMNWVRVLYNRPSKGARLVVGRGKDLAPTRYSMEALRNAEPGWVKNRTSLTGTRTVKLGDKLPVRFDGFPFCLSFDQNHHTASRYIGSDEVVGDRLFLIQNVAEALWDGGSRPI